MGNKIALEEHFLDPSTVDYWWPTMVDVARAKADDLHACLTDFGDRRRLLTRGNLKAVRLITCLEWE